MLFIRWQVTLGKGITEGGDCFQNENCRHRPRVGSTKIRWWKVRQDVCMTREVKLGLERTSVGAFSLRSS